jgi:NADH-quinone oxidoreductase subunit M
MGFAVVVASALTGLAVLRMYFSLFCGRPEVLTHPSLRLGLRPREAWTFVALVTALIGLGLAPRPLVDSRFDASEEILRLRQGAHVAGIELQMLTATSVAACDARPMSSNRSTAMTSSPAPRSP